MINKVKKTLGENVIVFPPEASKSMVGVVMVPGSRSNIGVVKHLGEDIKSPQIQVGDKVLYGKNFESIKVENQDAWIMNYSNVIAIIEG